MSKSNKISPIIKNPSKSLEGSGAFPVFFKSVTPESHSSFESAQHQNNSSDSLDTFFKPPGILRKENESSTSGSMSVEGFLYSGSGGQTLKADDRNFFESRMGYDFGQVKIHNDTDAARSAKSINALAYTNGNNIVFDAGQYAPETNTGKKLLAHELTHVIQQNNSTIPKSISRIPQKIIQKQSAPRQIIPRGPNPGDCIGALCQSFAASGRPRNLAAANTFTDNWLRDSLACLHNQGAGSNASHHAEITQNEETELQQDAAGLHDYLTSQSGRRGLMNDFMEEFGRLCPRKQREISIEFGYNLILENTDPFVWGYTPADDWNGIEAAFASLPAEATWTNPQLLRFRRNDIHPTQPNVAGETDIPTGQITIFNRGFGSAPYSRSSATGIPATTQTIQHEIGHIIVSQIPRPDYNNFFNNILHWDTFSWAWVTAPTHDTHRAERNRLKSVTGMDDTRLDAWLGTLQQGTRVDVGNRGYVRGMYHLESFDANQVPSNQVFEYAATNKDDYLSEVYVFAVSNPGYLHRVLPAAQITWLKDVVFKTPSNINDLSRMYALGEPQQTEFLRRAARAFTWEQINAILNEVTIQGVGPGIGALG